MTVLELTSGLHSMLFQRLIKIVPDLEGLGGHGKSTVSGFMDLNLDVLQQRHDKWLVALSQYFLHPCGDMVADPDMLIAIYPLRGEAEALTYQNAFSYQEVYTCGGMKVDVRAKRELNVFLNQWLLSLIAQGHRIQAGGKKATSAAA